MIVLGIAIVYLVFMHIMCMARSGRSLFYMTSNFFRKLEAMQKTFFACLPVYWNDFWIEVDKEMKKIAEEMVNT